MVKKHVCETEHGLWNGMFRMIKILMLLTKNKI